MVNKALCTWVPEILENIICVKVAAPELKDSFVKIKRGAPLKMYPVAVSCDMSGMYIMQSLDE